LGINNAVGLTPGEYIGTGRQADKAADLQYIHRNRHAYKETYIHA